ncbi:MAG: BlaI/MecI/CopY family transcriptional regulator [Clostridia bacterium]
MIKLQNSELKIMEVLWKNGIMPARKVAEIIEDNYGWNINTTYTLIKRIIKKEGIKREDPNFMCIPLVKREEVLKTEIKELAEKFLEAQLICFLLLYLQIKVYQKIKSKNQNK